MLIKFNTKYEGACPHCRCCGRRFYNDAEGYPCADGCRYVRNFHEAIRDRYDALQKARQQRARRNELRPLLKLQWKEETWFRTEFPNHYSSGWALKIADLDGHEYWLHSKGEKKVLSYRGPLPLAMLAGGNVVVRDNESLDY